MWSLLIKLENKTFGPTFFNNIFWISRNLIMIKIYNKFKITIVFRIDKCSSGLFFLKWTGTEKSLNYFLCIKWCILSDLSKV